MTRNNNDGFHETKQTTDRTQTPDNALANVLGNPQHFHMPQDTQPGPSGTQGAENKRSASSAFGEVEANQGPIHPKRSKAIEGSNHAGVQEQPYGFTDWEREKAQLLQKQTAETEQSRQQEPRNYQEEKIMTHRHTQELKALLEKRPAETSRDNDHPTPDSNKARAQENSSPFHREIMASARLLQQRMRGRDSQAGRNEDVNKPESSAPEQRHPSGHNPDWENEIINWDGGEA